MFPSSYVCRGVPNYFNLCDIRVFNLRILRTKCVLPIYHSASLAVDWVLFNINNPSRLQPRGRPKNITARKH